MLCPCFLCAIKPKECFIKRRGWKPRKRQNVGPHPTVENAFTRKGVCDTQATMQTGGGRLGPMRRRNNTLEAVPPTPVPASQPAQWRILLPASGLTWFRGEIIRSALSAFFPHHYTSLHLSVLRRNFLYIVSKHFPSSPPGLSPCLLQCNQTNPKANPNKRRKINSRSFFGDENVAGYRGVS